MIYLVESSVCWTSFTSESIEKKIKIVTTIYVCVSVNFLNIMVKPAITYR